MDNGRSIAWALAIAGLIPFVGCAAMVAAGGANADDWLAALIAYAAVILSFLGGTRWGWAMANASPDPKALLLSNLPAIAAWVALVPVGTSSSGRLSLLASGLTLMWLWDRDRLPAWYPAIRTVATLGALLSLGLAFLTA